jgi:hypothetical protein
MGVAGSRSDGSRPCGAETRCFRFFKAHLSLAIWRISIPAPLTLARAAPADRAMSIKISSNLLRYRNFGQLERHVAAMVHDLGADLDQLIPQAGTGSLRVPIVESTWQRR